MSSSSATVKHLDTKKFDSTITAFKSGISQYNDIKSEVEKATNTLLGSWQGKGKAQFEKDYTTIYRQLTDIADIMYELHDALIEAEAAYIQADEEAAKMLTIE